MDLNFVKALQSLRNPIFDWFFYLVTQIGDQYVFIFIAVIMYWTMNKKYAHRFVFTFMISAIVNTAIKEMVQRTRPYLASNDVFVKESWKTSGYSFPSGHSQAAGVLGYTAYDASRKLKKPWIWYIGIFIMIFVPLSRVYLGQHYLSDVVVGLLLAFFLAPLVFKLIDKMGDNEDIYTLMLVPFFLLSLFFVQNEIMFVAAGGFAGFAIGYYLEKKHVKYDVRSKPWIQVIKVVLGILVIFGIRLGLKAILPYSIHAEHDPVLLDLIFDFIRYFFIGVWAAYGAPLVFKYVDKSR